MIKSIKINRRRRHAQGMTEYIIIVGLIAILLIAAVNELSDKLKETYQASTKVVDAKVTQPITKAGAAK